MSTAVLDCWMQAVKWLKSGKMNTKCPHMGSSNDEVEIESVYSPCVAESFVKKNQKNSKFLTIQDTMLSSALLNLCSYSQYNKILSYVAPLSINSQTLSPLSTWITSSITAIWDYLFIPSICHKVEKTATMITTNIEFAMLGHSIVSGG